MSALNQVFSFEDMAAGDKASREVIQFFQRAKQVVVSQNIDSKIRRTSGQSYREMSFSFADNQTVVLRIKSTGDVFQVLLNGKILPIKHQDDQTKAIIEISNALDSNRTKHQKKLASLAVKLPSGIKTAQPTQIARLTERRDQLKEAIAETESEIARIKADSGHF